jgi:hypothetical protein
MIGRGQPRVMLLLVGESPLHLHRLTQLRIVTRGSRVK